MEDAGTMSTVFTTAIYALCHLCPPSRTGQIILIHSACGAVGIAAIQLAQMVGAKIFAMVGNREKVQYLVETFSIPREQIFDSHSNSSMQDVMTATDGQGVDVALNSLAGELLHSTWGEQCFPGVLLQWYHRLYKCTSHTYSNINPAS
ncbi:hypothetical protein F5B22DRAFT_83058 [Xylaria bambusicola]|uniref:uncharacterized protein n=1 Tax=Xylaria bambusicola TaxID=326684 RepID=UPI002007F97F|nr:uncharacterized protein F5B22DRAFT_83058 [Xylaria bambusicola]KAI0518377.1 hypothetical protein F5B22DRAFT_83058 [Xylaria bambusicola]